MIEWRKKDGEYTGSVLGNDLYQIWHTRHNGRPGLGGGWVSLWHLGFGPDFREIKSEFGPAKFRELMAVADCHLAEIIGPAIESAIADQSESRTVTNEAARMT